MRQWGNRCAALNKSQTDQSGENAKSAQFRPYSFTSLHAGSNIIPGHSYSPKGTRIIDGSEGESMGSGGKIAHWPEW